MPTLDDLLNKYNKPSETKAVVETSSKQVEKKQLTETEKAELNAMDKRDVLKSLEYIQRKANEDVAKVRDLIKSVKAIDGEMDVDTSSTIRHQMFHLSDYAYSVKEAVTSLEGRMHSAEKRCVQCGECGNTEKDGKLDWDKEEGLIHVGCLERLQANRKAFDEDLKEFTASGGWKRLDEAYNA